VDFNRTKMIIYLADLLHTGQGKSRDHVPLAPGYLAASAKKRFPDLDIRIFRDPQVLLDAVKEKKPAIVGFSVYAWSERLSAFAAKRVKEISSKIVTVAGGPSVDDIDEELVDFLKTYLGYDIAVPNEGEISFINIIEHVKKNKGLVPDEIIEGCARLSSVGTLLRGNYVWPELEDLPSPYLEGYMSPFLEQGYLPLLQTMRGCPYSCKYCCSGTKLWSKLRAFDLKRVFAEFDYIRKHTKRSYLYLTDENIGLLKERDIKLAQYIRESYDTTKFPSHVLTYTDKHMTDTVQKIKDIMQPISDFNVSFQTLNEDASRAINRINLRKEDTPEYLRWAREKGIPTTTEMIFGFPYETSESFILGLEWLIKNGFDYVSSYDLRLFRGSDLFMESHRKQYCLKTMFRMGEKSFGIYDGKVVLDMEEIVVSSNTFGFNDFIKVRKYCFFFYLAYGARYLSELINIMIHVGLPGEKLIAYFVDYYYERLPLMGAIMKEWNKRIREELFESPEGCIGHVKELVSQKINVPATKINLIYTGKIMFDSETRNELMNIVRDFIAKYSSEEKVVDFFDDYLDNVLGKQIIDFSSPGDSSITTKTRINMERVGKDDYSSVNELLLSNNITLNLVMESEVANYLKQKPLNNLYNELLIEDIFLVNKKWVKRKWRIEKSSEPYYRALSDVLFLR